jgi:hypothetical protein
MNSKALQLRYLTPVPQARARGRRNVHRRLVPARARVGRSDQLIGEIVEALLVGLVQLLSKPVPGQSGRG